MKRIINMRIGMGAAAAALVTLLAAGSAHAERRPPFGNDAQLLEANVRDEVQRRIAPVLEEMAPGQAELEVRRRARQPPHGAAGGRGARVRGADARDRVRGGAGRGGADARREAPRAVPQGPQEPHQEQARRARRARRDHRERDRLSDAAAAAAAARDAPLRLSAAAAAAAARARAARAAAAPRRRCRRPRRRPTARRTESPGSWPSRWRSWACSSARSASPC